MRRLLYQIAEVTYSTEFEAAFLRAMAGTYNQENNLGLSDVEIDTVVNDRQEIHRLHAQTHQSLGPIYSRYTYSEYYVEEDDVDA